MPGPLAGVRIVELAGIGPVPFAAMLLADLGADVLRIDRVTATEGGAPTVGPGASASTATEGGAPTVGPGASASTATEGGAPTVGPGASANTAVQPGIILRGRRSIAVDLKQAAGRRVVLDLVADADALIEGFRPGVAERLGVGPDACLAVNPRLVYGRMTGWGQDGPLARTAGHDIAYMALTGALYGSRRAGERPVPPMNLVGDLGGGALYLALGVVSALYEAWHSGHGQVIDAAIVDGTASLTNFILGLRAQGDWNGEPGNNLLDTGAPFYDVYTCADGREIAIGPLEPRFYAELLRLSGVEVTDELSPERRGDRAAWPAAKKRWAELFATKTRDEWTATFEGTEACVAPVLDWDEAPAHPHLAARGTFIERDGVSQAAPAPRFSRTAAELGRPPASPGEHTDEVLAELGRSPEEIAALRAAGAVG